MFDPAAIGAALTSLKAILDLAKGANNARLAVAISAQVAEIQGKLLDVQQQALALQHENGEVRAELLEVKKDALVFLDGGVNWEKRPDGKHDGPLCPVCWGINHNRLPMVKNETRNHPDYVVFLCNHHPEIVVDRKVPKDVLEKYGA